MCGLIYVSVVVVDHYIGSEGMPAGVVVIYIQLAEKSHWKTAPIRRPFFKSFDTKHNLRIEYFDKDIVMFLCNSDDVHRIYLFIYSLFIVCALCSVASINAIFCGHS